MFPAKKGVIVFNTLEEIKTFCEQLFVGSPIQINSQIAESQMPPNRTYQCEVVYLPPLSGKEHLSEVGKLKLLIHESGFDAKIENGKIVNGGFRLSISVKDKSAPAFSKGEVVLFRGDPLAPLTKFRIVNYKWNLTLKDYEYKIQNDTGAGFNSVAQNDLQKVR